MSIAVVLPYWPDRPPLEALDIAAAAERLGYDEVWVGEMATFDAFALAGAIAMKTQLIPITVGPLAVAVRDPVALALGVSSIATLGGRPAHLALGLSTPVVVSAWHSRSWEGSGSRLRETIPPLRQLFAGEKTDFDGEHISTRGFRLRLDASATTITVAAFGDATIATAGRLADRMVINLVTPKQAAALRAKLEHASVNAGRPVPPLAAWLAVAVDPTEEARQQIRSMLVVYLAAPGYGEMFIDAGFGSLVERARGGTHPKELLAAISDEMISAVAAVGDEATVRKRIDEYHAAGVDQVAVVPATGGDAGAERTLAALRPR